MMIPDMQPSALLRFLITSSGARRLDSPDGSLEVQGAVATREGGDVLGQDHAFLVGRRLSQEGGKEAKRRAQLGFQRVAGRLPVLRRYARPTEDPEQPLDGDPRVERLESGSGALPGVLVDDELPAGLPEVATTRPRPMRTCTVRWNAA